MALVTDEARRLYADARTNHRLAQQHRRAAQQQMEQLRRFCEAHGIAFEIVTQSREDRVSGQRKPT